MKHLRIVGLAAVVVLIVISPAGYAVSAGPPAGGPTMEMAPVDVLSASSVSMADRSEPAVSDAGASTSQDFRPALDPTAFALAKSLAGSQEGARLADDAGWVDNIEEFAGPEPLGHTNELNIAGLAGTSGQNMWAGIATSTKKYLQSTYRQIRLGPFAGAPQDITLDTLFGTSPVINARVFFDRLGTAKRFYIIGQKTVYSPSPRLSRIFLAVSRSESPSGFTGSDWCLYYFNARRQAGTSADNNADISGLGAGLDALVIASSQYSYAYKSFLYSMVWVLNKVTLANNGTSCPSLPKVYAFQASPYPGVDWTAFGLQPVRHYNAPTSFTGTTNPVYLVNSNEPLGATATQYRLWRVRNVASGSPKMAGTGLIVGSYAFSYPPDAPQSGTGILLNTYDARITQAAGVANTIWAVHATACNMGGGALESCVRPVRFTVGQDGSGAPTAAIGQQATVGGGAGVFYWAPGISVNLAGANILVFERSKATGYLSIWFTGKTAGALSYEPAVLLNAQAGGSCAFTAYGSPAQNVQAAAAHTDPGGTKFWMTGARSVNLGAGCQWYTWVTRVTPP